MIFIEKSYLVKSKKGFGFQPLAKHNQSNTNGRKQSLLNHPSLPFQNPSFLSIKAPFLTQYPGLLSKPFLLFYFYPRPLLPFPFVVYPSFRFLSLKKPFFFFIFKPRILSHFLFETYLPFKPLIYFSFPKKLLLPFPL